MNKKSIVIWALDGLMVLLLAGCGDGGTGGAAAPSQQFSPAIVILKMVTQGTLPAETSLSGVSVTISLPAGVTPVMHSTGDVDSATVTVSGVAIPSNSLPPTYTPATGTAPATLELVITNMAAEGFGVGEFVTVTCSVTPGSYPREEDFSVLNFSAITLTGEATTTVKPAFIAEIK